MYVVASCTRLLVSASAAPLPQVGVGESARRRAGDLDRCARLREGGVHRFPIESVQDAVRYICNCLPGMVQLQAAASVSQPHPRFCARIHIWLIGSFGSCCIFFWCSGLNGMRRTQKSVYIVFLRATMHLSVGSSHACLRIMTPWIIILRIEESD